MLLAARREYPLASLTWPYIAGFFDGEGSCGLYGKEGKGLGRVVASIAQRDSRVLDDIRYFLSTYGIACSIRSRITGKLSTNPCTTLTLSEVAAVKFLTLIVPYLRVKQTIAQDLIRWKALYPRYTTLARSTLAKDWRRRKATT